MLKEEVLMPRLMFDLQNDQSENHHAPFRREVWHF